MFYISADVRPREDATAQRLGQIADLLFRYSRKDFNIRVGECEIHYTDQPRFTVVVDSPRTVRRLLLRRSPYAAGEAFTAKSLEIEGDLVSGLKTKADLGDRLATLRAGEKLKILLNLIRI